MIQHQESATSLDDLERWVESHGPALLLFAQQQTGSFADAQDVYQDAIIKVLREARVNTGQIPPLGRMFLAIKHRAIDLHRERQRRQTRESHYAVEVLDGGNSWFERGLEQRERKEGLMKAIQSLPPEQQAVLILKIWGEQTFRNIGDILGVPAATAASRYRYGLSLVRSKLETIS